MGIGRWPVVGGRWAVGATGIPVSSRVVGRWQGPAVEAFLLAQKVLNWHSWDPCNLQLPAAAHPKPSQNSKHAWASRAVQMLPINGADDHQTGGPDTPTKVKPAIQVRSSQAHVLSKTELQFQCSAVQCSAVQYLSFHLNSTHSSLISAA